MRCSFFVTILVLSFTFFGGCNEVEPLQKGSTIYVPLDESVSAIQHELSDQQDSYLAGSWTIEAINGPVRISTFCFDFILDPNFAKIYSYIDSYELSVNEKVFRIDRNTLCSERIFQSIDENKSVDITLSIIYRRSTTVLPDDVGLTYRMVLFTGTYFDNQDIETVQLLLHSGLEIELR